MKAAVLQAIGGGPRYEDFPDPVAGDHFGRSMQLARGSATTSVS
jgi:hypothetical protein